jgi:dihydroorotate dehydrogenase (fumarate)
MDLSTQYMGMSLRNPLIVASSGITQSVEGVVRCAEAGAGAVVLKSVFEESILAEAREVIDGSRFPTEYPEGRDYVERYSQEEAFGFYLKLIREAKSAVSIPVIGSVHCVSASSWTEYANRLQEAGADAIELNVFVLPIDAQREPRSYEQLYFDVADSVRRHVSIPVALKIGPYFSGLARTAVELSERVGALVLFNRYYRLDIDPESMRIVPAAPFSEPQESVVPLRWISILSGRVKCDLAATTGIHDGAGVVKQLLAGANAVQVCSALYRRSSLDYLRTMLDEVSDWMRRHEFRSVNAFRGKLSQINSKDPEAYERVQFMLQTANRSLD